MNTYFKILDSKNFKDDSLETLLYNKLTFDIFCKKNIIPTPTIISYNFNKNFYLDNQIIQITTWQQLKEYFQQQVKKQDSKSLFLKPIEGYQGGGIFKVTQSTNNQEYKKLFDKLSRKLYLHQEEIIQHKKINQIYNKSINTVRLETYIDTNGNVHFLGVFIRFGVGNSIVDNVSAGGLFVPVDIDSGKLFDYGYLSKFSFYKKCLEHPNSKFKFENFVIPYFDEVKNIVMNATLKIPKKIIGWDIAITPSGPIIIEGNFYPGLLFGEFSYNGYKNKPIFKEIIAEAIK